MAASNYVPDMEALQEEFIRYLVIGRQKTLDVQEKAAAVQEHTKSGIMGKIARIKQQVKEKYDESRQQIQEKLELSRQQFDEKVEVSKQQYYETVEYGKQKYEQKMDTVRQFKHLKSDELEAVKQFMDQVKQLREQPPPPPLKRPEGLELNLIGIALFSGDETVSRLIRRVTKSSYSHVALLLHDVSKPPEDPDGWYVYSANGSASQIMADRRMPQVQLEKWVETIASYEGAVVTRLFLYDAESKPSSAVITELIDKYIGLPYETQLLVMLKAMNRSNVEAEGHANSAFCSEICYRFLAAAKVLEDTQIPENVWPKDFSDEEVRLQLAAAKWAEQVLCKGVIPPLPK